VGCEDLENYSKSGWLLTAQNLETAAKICELMARKQQTTLKLIRKQLHINHELVRQIHYIFGKKETLSEVCATVPWTRKKRKESQLVKTSSRPVKPTQCTVTEDILGVST